MVGLGVTVATFLKVERLAESLRRRYFEEYLREKMDAIVSLPKTRRKALTESSISDVNAIVHTIEHSYISSWFWVHGKRRRLVAQLRVEIDGEKRVEPVRHLVKLLQAEILIR